MTNAVNGVEAGKELWFPNTGCRIADGTTYTDIYGITTGTFGNYWLSTPNGSSAYLLQFYSAYPTGRLPATGDKLFALPVRCVR